MAVKFSLVRRVALRPACLCFCVVIAVLLWVVWRTVSGWRQTSSISSDSAALLSNSLTNAEYQIMVFLRQPARSHLMESQLAQHQNYQMFQHWLSSLLPVCEYKDMKIKCPWRAWKVVVPKEFSIPLEDSGPVLCWPACLTGLRSQYSSVCLSGFVFLSFSIASTLTLNTNTKIPKERTHPLFSCNKYFLNKSSPEKILGELMLALGSPLQAAAIEIFKWFFKHTFHGLDLSEVMW